MCWTENLDKSMQTRLQGPISNAAVARIERQSSSKRYYESANLSSSANFKMF